MNFVILLFDIGVTGLGVILGLVFFSIFAVVALVAYKMLKRTAKMAMRMTIVAAILLIALIGSIALLWIGSSGGGNQRPARPTPQSRNAR